MDQSQRDGSMEQGNPIDRSKLLAQENEDEKQGEIVFCLENSWRTYKIN
jgi:hypothetical protein